MLCICEIWVSRIARALLVENGGKGVSTDHLQALAKELGVTVSHLIGDETREAAGNYKASGTRAALLADYAAPDGLRQLASDTALTDALKITDAEWKALESIQLPGEVSKDGYVQLLITIRAITTRYRKNPSSNSRN